MSWTLARLYPIATLSSLRVRTLRLPCLKTELLIEVDFPYRTHYESTVNGHGRNYLPWRCVQEYPRGPPVGTPKNGRNHLMRTGGHARAAPPVQALISYFKPDAREANTSLSTGTADIALGQPT